MKYTFPEITRRNAQCRVCRLVDTKPAVVFTLHELHKRGGLTDRQLVEKIAPVFAEAGETVPARAAIQNHFKNHCGTPVPVIESSDDYASDYQELRGVYNEFRTIFTKLRTDFANEKDKKASDYWLVMLVKLAGELRNMLKTLSDMRRDEKLFNIILVRHTEALVQQLAEPLGLALRDIQDRLARSEDPTLVAQRVEQLLAGDLHPIFERAAKHALESSQQEYKVLH
jgi:hypothetical protein